MAEVTQTITIPSKRIYCSSLSPTDIGLLLETVDEFNTLKEWYYNRLYNSRYDDWTSEPTVEEIHEYCMGRFGHDISGYYITSLHSTVSGMINSQSELLKRYKEDRDLRVQNRVRKIAIVQTALTTAKNFKAALAAFHRENKRYPTRKEITIPKRYESRYPKMDNLDPKEYQEQVYLFECWLDERIRANRRTLHQLNEAQKRDLDRKFDRPARITFGGKAFYKLKDTKYQTRKQRAWWAEERDYRRNKMVLLSGRHTSRYGNFQCRYNPEDHTADIEMFRLGHTLHLENVEFPYRGEELLKNWQASPQDRVSVGYQIEMRRDTLNGKYFLLKATIQLSKEIHADTVDGVIAIDINADRIDWAELNHDGCRINGGMIPMKLQGLSSGQRKNVAGRVSSRVIDLCVKKHKPLIMEKLDFTTKKAKLKYNNRKANHIISSFNYAQMTGLLQGKAFQRNVGVETVDPAYTSCMAEIKYMKNRKGAVHTSAAVVIGRRGMGYKEKIPSYLFRLVKGKADINKAIYKLTKGVRKETFYRKLPIFRNEADFQAKTQT